MEANKDSSSSKTQTTEGMESGLTSQNSVSTGHFSIVSMSIHTVTDSEGNGDEVQSPIPENVPSPSDTSGPEMDISDSRDQESSTQSNSQSDQSSSDSANASINNEEITTQVKSSAGEGCNSSASETSENQSITELNKNENGQINNKEETSN